MKPRERPIVPDPNELPRKHLDENAWIWYKYQDLNENMGKAVAPL